MAAMPRGGSRPGAGGPRGPHKTTEEKRIALGINERIKEMERAAKRAMNAPAREALKIAATTTSPAERELAIDIMAKYAKFFDGLASHYSPRPPEVPQNPNYKEPEFRYYAGRTFRWCSALAKYQSPTLRAVSIIDRSAPPEQTGPIIDGDNVVRIGDFTASSRVYENMLKTGKRTSGGRG